MSDSQPFPHQLILDERRQLHVTGVTDVDSYDDTTVALKTQAGELTVKGSSLHISRLNVEAGDLAVEGMITSLEYREPEPSGRSRFMRLFR